MSTNNLRYFQLMTQTEKNPLRPLAAPAFDIASDYRRDVERIAADRRLSPEGRRDEAQKHLRKALRDLRDLRRPLDEYRAKTETMAAAAKRPPIDKTDFVAAMSRRELRDLSRTLTPAQREMRLTGKHRDQAFVDAVLEHEPWVSGIDAFNPVERDVYEAAQRERLADFHGPLLAQIAERDATESEVRDLIVAVARGDIQHDSGLELAEFADVAKEIEQRAGAVWLTPDKSQVIDIALDGKASYRVATPDEVRDGRLYTPEAFAASRAA